jgi:membrane protease subunit (stomatin/prohibitin family)
MAKIRLYSADMSRRGVLKSVAAVAAGMTLAAACETALAAKKQKSQADAEYQDHPHGKERCDNCEPFQPPNKCRTVSGTVAAQGWCKLYVEK